MSNNRQTTEQVIKIIGVVRASKNVLTQETTLKDLGIGELDRIELVMRLEDQFRIHIDDEQFGKCTSIDDVAQYVESMKS